MADPPQNPGVSGAAVSKQGPQADEHRIGHEPACSLGEAEAELHHAVPQPPPVLMPVPFLGVEPPAWVVPFPEVECVLIV
jgi:hypothetical protein